MSLRSPSGLTANPLPMIVLALAIAVASPFLGSCSPNPKSGGGIGGTGSVTASSISSGPVTNLSSLSVSGTEYDTYNALFCIDGEPCSTKNSLKLGMVVVVNGTAQSTSNEQINRVANTITLEETVQGVVQSVVPDGSGLVVLGQVLEVNQKTVIDESIPGRSLRNLKPGTDIIEVSGLISGDGHILATLIMSHNGTPHYGVQGIIKNHDVQGKRFEIGQLVVEYSSADISDITAGGTNWNNLLVKVRGDEWQPSGELPYAATLRASRVTRMGLTDEYSAEAKIEGFITHVTASEAFSINNHPIEVSSTTTFQRGTANDLKLGTHVLIHGALAQGVLKADEVMFKENLQIESNIESLDLQSRTLTVAGLPGLSIETDSQTVVEHGGMVASFENIIIGDHLKIYARLVDGQRVFATELERTDPSDAIVLEAPLQSAIDPQILLAGVIVDTSGILENGFIGAYEPIGRVAFFENALIGRPVWGKGTLRGGLVTWNSVGISR